MTLANLTDRSFVCYQNAYVQNRDSQYDGMSREITRFMGDQDGAAPMM